MSDFPFLVEGIEIPWSALTVEHIESSMDEALRRAEVALTALIESDDVSYEGTFKAYEKLVDTVSNPWGLISHLENVENTSEFRKAYEATDPKVTRFLSGLPLNGELWKRLKSFGESAGVKDLDPIGQRLVEETMLGFRESGADLEEAKKSRLLAIEETLTDLTSKFGMHAMDSRNAFELLIEDEARLSGLPESAREAAREDALNKGHGSEATPVWRFTLAAPSLMAVMQYADDDGLRKAIWEGSNAVARSEPYDNEPLIREILKLRHEKALLLGKAHFADVVLEDRMAKKGQTAVAFIEDLYGRTKEAFEREAEELIAFKAKVTGEPAGPLNPWETGYWVEKMRKATCDFDEEVLRPYFPVEGVLRGMFEICETVFGVRVEEQRGEDKPDVWDQDVGYFKIYDGPSGRLLGAFYTDWYPRESKRSGAWMMPLFSGESKDMKGLPSAHLGGMMGNMTRPLKGKPALLTHSEVETIFHEFGHLLHHLLSEVPLAGLSGTNVAWDFVELPSQMMENWCWERESLDCFARHYETGERLPEDLFKKLWATKTFRTATGQMRQLLFGRCDLAMHMDPEAVLTSDNLDTWWREEIKDYLSPSTVEPTSNLRSFSHLFGSSVGYAAGYYSYKWAEVLDADAFTRFKEEGILSPKVGSDFREAILSKGNSEDAEVLFRKFMGRDANSKALMERLGIGGFLLGSDCMKVP